MIFIRRLMISCIFILFILSIYHDLKKSSISQQQFPKINESITTENYSIIQKKVLPGETTLSIIELINDGQLKHINIYELLEDFKQINPKVDPLNLKQGSYYNFPKYD